MTAPGPVALGDRTRRYVDRLIREAYPADGLYDVQHLLNLLDIERGSMEYKRFSLRVLTPLFGKDRNFRLTREDLIAAVLLGLETEPEWGSR